MRLVSGWGVRAELENKDSQVCSDVLFAAKATPSTRLGHRELLLRTVNLTDNGKAQDRESTSVQRGLEV